MAPPVQSHQFGLDTTRGSAPFGAHGAHDRSFDCPFRVLLDSWEVGCCGTYLGRGLGLCGQRPLISGRGGGALVSSGLTDPASMAPSPLFAMGGLFRGGRFEAGGGTPSGGNMWEDRNALGK